MMVRCEPSGTLRSTEPDRPGWTRRFAPWPPVPYTSTIAGSGVGPEVGSSASGAAGVALAPGVAVGVLVLVLEDETVSGVLVLAVVALGAGDGVAATVGELVGDGGVVGTGVGATVGVEGGA